MHHPTPPRSRRRLAGVLAPLALATLAACSGDSGGGTGPQPSEPAAVLVTSRNPHPGMVGQMLPDSVQVRVVDAAGRPVEDVAVTFAVTAGGGEMVPAIVRTNANGYARAIWVIGDAGPFTATAAVAGLPPAQLQARTVEVSAQATPMFGQLGEILTWSVNRLTTDLPLNPGSAPYYREKLAMLRAPGLGGDILDQRRYAEGGLLSRSGSTIPVTAIFPVEAMRDEAVETIEFAEASLPLVEDFLELPFPRPEIRLWHGFVMGNSGGGGALHMEDRATYAERTQGAAFVPYDGIIVHELSHTWTAHESLTQLLELYGYNRLRLGTDDPLKWTFDRDYVADRDANAGVHALLDVYRMIGPEAMAQGYRNVIPLRPLYSQPLSAEMQKAFVDAAPEALKTAVAAKMAKVGT